VAEIIDLEKRRQHSMSGDDRTGRQEKIEVLRRVLHCSRCAMRCARCGVQIEEFGSKTANQCPYPLCSGCRQEYEIYLKRSDGKPTSGNYWYNDAWMAVWRTWLEHQQALDRYRSSEEFLKLLEEFDELC